MLIVYRDDVLLRIPAAATSLYPALSELPSSKLSIDGIRDLIRRTRQFGMDGQLTLTCQVVGDCTEHESKSDLAKSHGSQGGEP
jgi:hypothetical protein